MSEPEIKRMEDELPRARVGTRRWIVSAVWLVPLVAAIVAGYLVYDRYRQYGPDITIRFRDGSGVRPGQTPVLYRGVPVAEVTQVTLSEDQRSVEVRARVQRSASSIAREGSVFWIVRPEVGIGQITGLSTVITGPEIQVLPGKGEARYEFTGLDNAPAALDLTGLKIILRASRLGSPQRNSPVYFRGVEVGVVQETDLSSDATSVDLHVVIRQRYARLVRTDSVFWNVSGAHVSAGLFKGLDFRMESLKALAAGGIAFASAGDPGAKAARQGQVFPLYADARKEWLDWNAPIRIPSQKGAEPAADPAEAKAHPPKAPKEARPKVGPDTSRVPWSAGG